MKEFVTFMALPCAKPLTFARLEKVPILCRELRHTSLMSMGLPSLSQGKSANLAPQSTSLASMAARY